ncbi:hypothetical protein K7711_31850 [Nocardia sp. CA2R105]|uniref:hypothetical protein n=1 Tax=Nocardia coffeae TaxID=2873381 RepID=UPI001CA61D0A|nr:hypothetical protein [Nocardia coffeae]MBY8861108.1 hypothetical protein [Nocardia coffeae]
MSSQADRLSWLREKPLQAPTILNHWDGVPSIMLFKIPSGAILWWMFDEDGDEQLGLFAHLTHDEAQAVFEGSLSEGLLEPIRKTMSYPEAVVWAIRRNGMYAAEFMIPTKSGEPEFANLVWEAAENTAERRSISGLSHTVSRTHRQLRLLNV